jgi:hypothetical protein
MAPTTDRQRLSLRCVRTTANSEDARYRPFLANNVSVLALCRVGAGEPAHGTRGVSNGHEWMASVMAAAAAAKAIEDGSFAPLAAAHLPPRKGPLTATYRLLAIHL